MLLFSCLVWRINLFQVFLLTKEVGKNILIINKIIFSLTFYTFHIQV